MNTIDIYESEEFERKLKQLNALCDSMSNWSETRAAKDHEDEFGSRITSGDMYYKRELGGGFGNNLKLSRQTMDQFLFSLFGNNELLRNLADTMITIEEVRTQEVIDKIEKKFEES